MENVGEKKRKTGDGGGKRKILLVGLYTAYGITARQILTAGTSSESRNKILNYFVQRTIIRVINERENRDFLRVYKYEKNKSFSFSLAHSFRLLAIFQ